MPVAKCKGCGRPIAWVKTPKDKWIPVDVDQEYLIVTKQGQVVSGRIAHWATCPKSDQFRNKWPKSKGDQNYGRVEDRGSPSKT